MELELRERLRAFQAELAEVQNAAGRAADSITVVAVTKTQPQTTVKCVIDAGISDIGENYFQEARTKFDGLPKVRKHFLGHVQTNKAKGIVELFDMVQSVDRLDAGTALAKAARSAGRTLPVLVQINVSPAERFGAPPDEAERLAEQLRSQEGLAVEGVMAIGPITEDKTEISRAFERAAKTFERIGGSTLSLGMSGDWRQAVACGSTMLRIGTSLFGPRAKKEAQQ